jgi:hypothetical protein
MVSSEATSTTYDCAGGANKLVTEKHFSVVEFTANKDFPEECFDLDLPSGTTVGDHIANTAYQVP